MRRFLICVCAFLMLASVSMVAQDYVGRFDVSSGFSYLAEPKINLAGRGLYVQGGVNVTRWLTLGADWNYWWGHSTLYPKELAADKQAALAAALGPLASQVFVPFDSQTWSFAAGPQINIRKFNKVTFFVRPVLGAMHEQVTVKPTNPLAQAAVTGLLGATNKKNDLTTFYGFGGGFDLNFSKHVALRAQSDFVHVFLFEGTLKEARNATRVSVGPAFHWGGNVK